MLADTVRTDRARLRPLSVDSAATVTLRMTVRARKDLVYFVAIRHWEVFLSYAYHAHEILASTGEAALFERGDGSVLQRLNHLYNRSKHVKTAIGAGQLAPGSTLPVWLTNDGLSAVDGHLTFDEMAEMLDELALWSDAVQDPLTMADKLRAAFPRTTDEAAVADEASS